MIIRKERGLKTSEEIQNIHNTMNIMQSRIYELNKCLPFNLNEIEKKFSIYLIDSLTIEEMFDLIETLEWMFNMKIDEIVIVDEFFVKQFIKIRNKGDNFMTWEDINEKGYY